MDSSEKRSSSSNSGNSGSSEMNAASSSSFSSQLQPEPHHPKLEALKDALASGDTDEIRTLLSDHFHGSFPHVLVSIPHLPDTLMKSDKDVLEKSFDYRTCNLLTYAVLTVDNDSQLEEIVRLIVQHGGRALVNTVPVQDTTILISDSKVTAEIVIKEAAKNHTNESPAKEADKGQEKSKEKTEEGQDKNNNEERIKSKEKDGTVQDEKTKSGDKKGERSSYPFQVELPPLVALLMRWQPSDFDDDSSAKKLFTRLVKCGIDFQHKSPKSVFQSPDAVVCSSILRNAVLVLKVATAGGVDAQRVIADLRSFCVDKNPSLYSAGHAEAFFRQLAMKASMVVLGDLAPKGRRFMAVYRPLVTFLNRGSPDNATSNAGLVNGMPAGTITVAAPLKMKCRTLIFQRLSTFNKELPMNSKISRLPLPANLRAYVDYDDGVYEAALRVGKLIIEEKVMELRLDEYLNNFSIAFGRGALTAQRMRGNGGDSDGDSSSGEEGEEQGGSRCIRIRLGSLGK